MTRWQYLKEVWRILKSLFAKPEPAPIYFNTSHTHDALCKKYGCPDDSNWIGDRR